MQSVKLKRRRCGNNPSLADLKNDKTEYADLTVLPFQRISSSGGQYFEDGNFKMSIVESLQCVRGAEIYGKAEVSRIKRWKSVK